MFVTEKIQLWVCPDCAFAFDAVRKDISGSYSCPCCAELKLRQGIQEFVNRCVCDNGKAHLQNTIKVDCPRCTWARKILLETK